MRVYETTGEFYNSGEWRDFMDVLKLERVNKKTGLVHCEMCGKPITGWIIGHHVKELTNSNVNDVDVALNENNIQLVHPKCHDLHHSHLNNGTRHRYIVYGPSVTKCLEFVKENARKGDTICDMTSIRRAVTFDPDGDSKRTNDLVFGIRSLILDAIKHRGTKSINSWIIGQFPYDGERNRWIREYDCEEILIDCTKEEALDIEGPQNEKYVEQWFELQQRS